MLYEVITIKLSEPTGGETGRKIRQILALDEMPDNEEILRVITSYSIHYTKLYDGFPRAVYAFKYNEKRFHRSASAGLISLVNVSAAPIVPELNPRNPTTGMSDSMKNAPPFPASYNFV